MDRRDLLLAAGSMLGPGCAPARAAEPFRRCRPGDPAWPGPERWAALDAQVGGRLRRLQSPFAACRDAASCAELLKRIRNPYFLGDTPALAQSSGWAEAWAAHPGAYAVAARDAADVAAAVGFARDHALRLAVRGGGHSYQGTSSAANSLLVWTRPMGAITLHDDFVAAGCAGRQAPQPAVSIGAGAIWMQAYEAVMTGAGRYVQGGGCTTVGVAGLVLGGGFGSFSKAFGTAAGSLLEAEVVTADGAVRLANACTEPELFWALKGGGGGSFGVVTRLTLRTHALPESMGALRGTIRAASDAAFRALVDRFVAFCATDLCNPHWGETARLAPDNTLTLALVFQGLDQAGATATWRGFLDWVAAAPQDYALAEPVQVLAAPGRRLWDAAWLRRNVPGAVTFDDRPGAPPGNMVWAGDAGQAGQYLHGYGSAWLPAALLAPGRQAALAAALVEASRHWPVTLHLNKGLAGAPPEAIAAARDTAMHPAALDAFALAISGAAGPPAFPGQPGSAPDLAAARRHAAAIAAAMRALRQVAPGAGSYVSESDFFEAEWQAAFWGANYPRLLAAKRRYDPAGLFFVHHGVGSEGWSADGFVRSG